MSKPNEGDQMFGFAAEHFHEVTVPAMEAIAENVDPPEPPEFVAFNLWIHLTMYMVMGGYETDELVNEVRHYAELAKKDRAA